ncbi:MAG: DUF3134 domain-containing protein [Cyanobacteria bacterium P01_A01_bin.135]
MKNPALRAFPRTQPAGVISNERQVSILEWLEKSGRLMERDGEDSDLPKEDLEINELMGNEDNFEEDDDSMSVDD